MCEQVFGLEPNWPLLKLPVWSNGKETLPFWSSNGDIESSCLWYKSYTPEQVIVVNPWCGEVWIFWETSSIPLLLIPWIPASPGHQQPWYCLKFSGFCRKIAGPYQNVYNGWTVRETNALPLANASAFLAGRVENWLGQVKFCIEHIRDICFRASAGKI